MDKLADALRHRPDRAPPAQRPEAGRPLLTGQVVDGHGPGRRGHPGLRGDAPAGRPTGAGDDRHALRPGGGRAHHRRRRRPPRRRLRRRVQEPRCTPRATTTSRRPACRLEDGMATVTCACAEVGQGFVTLAQQIARDGARRRRGRARARPTRPSARPGSTSASRQTWMSGGAVRPREAVRGGAGRTGSPAPAIAVGIARRSTAASAGVELEAAPARPSRRPSSTTTPRPQPLDDDGQGDAHVSFAFAAHRAVVDVDPELGLVRVVDLATAQDVGRVLNPLQLLGQLEGGIAQGVGLAVMEEIVRRRRPGAEPDLHRLPDPHRARRARRAGGDLSSRSPSPAPRSGPRASASRRSSRRPRRWSRPSAPPPGTPLDAHPRAPVRHVRRD